MRGFDLLVGIAWVSLSSYNILKEDADKRIKGKVDFYTRLVMRHNCYYPVLPTFSKRRLLLEVHVKDGHYEYNFLQNCEVTEKFGPRF